MESCKNKNDKFSPHHIEGYQKYYGTTGSSSKGGCGVYVNESLNFTQRRDHDSRINEDGNEFESCWVELITSNECNTNRYFLKTSL